MHSTGSGYFTLKLQNSNIYLSFDDFGLPVAMLASSPSTVAKQACSLFFKRPASRKFQFLNSNESISSARASPLVVLPSKQIEVQIEQQQQHQQQQSDLKLMQQLSATENQLEHAQHSSQKTESTIEKIESPSMQPNDKQNESIKEDLQRWAAKRSVADKTDKGASDGVQKERKRHSYSFFARHKITIAWPNDLDIN